MSMDEAAELLGRAERLLRDRELAAGRDAFEEAGRHGADAGRCAWGRWMASMLGGDFEGAWRESDAIRTWDGEEPERFWQGEELGGKRVILRCLHGFGDSVHMLQYAARLRAACECLIVEVAPRFAEVARCFAGVDCVMTWDDPQPEWDVQVEVMELPHLFRTELGEFPIAEKYLLLPDDARARVRAVMGERTRPRVGVVWAAGEWNPERSVPFGLMKELAAQTGCELWSLQGGEEQRDWAGLRRTGLRRTGLRDAAECGEGLLTLAAVVAEMDLVITVDTLAAHLAGALGVPAWVLLQHAADWRWMVGRDDSPWYPSLRLFRQSTPGEWEGVVRRVREGLGTWLGEAR